MQCLAAKQSNGVGGGEMCTAKCAYFESPLSPPFLRFVGDEDRFDDEEEELRSRSSLR